MANHVNPPVSPTAAAHAARIRVGEEAANAEHEAPTAGQSTAELYAARILPGYKADEALREAARQAELRARGRWVPGDDAEDEEDEAEETAGEVDPLDNPERRSAKVAWKNARTSGYIGL
ncbi:MULTISPECIES: hypothetical protein [unclassified Streptomyces]|uniref:hypothetical protein n=1 Tax=unclassified Streptomyces TaxID=2593676 RepID=UPI001161E7CF|nr:MULTISPECIES: hypothetical protein [unclassified Streptomyces]NMI57102.1 hypothetical protein [Streptomyces sp. RLA2-12]QDN56482.1 hypothetical protein FNV67_15310 [Streptomyces sp. S1D4-20]QDN66659.1 hypothetical protein FNV66_14905 [Streptomyces sp. S1D4-14]QDO49066.1 hypothetical protein FNV60_13155 [Streptomyces sp. RLB3-5]QDO59307.1 hypothetical protein FNV59_15400 [Streptomyces sp. RLB1-8]